MTDSKSNITGQKFNSFLKDNIDFDILGFDFHDQAASAQLAAQLQNYVAPAGLLKNAVSESEQQQTSLLFNQAKAKQRTGRIAGDAVLADKLIEAGYDSAHKIAAIPARKFVQQFSPLIGSEQKASDIHARAIHIAETTMHLYANIKDTVASPHYNASSFKIENAALSNYYKNIPSYQQLFGSLNYLQCDDCQSIFSPAAYFLDIMRITDDYLSEPNISPVRTIPLHYTLADRRPDLFELKLNCSNTNTEISYLQLVNEILGKFIEHKFGIDSVFKALSVANYPFQLPYNMPLTKVRQHLEQVGVPLDRVLQSMLTSDINSANVHSVDVALEQLGISYQQFKLISKEDFSVDALTSSYGFNTPYQAPGYPGSGNLLFIKGQNKVAGVGTKFTSEMKVNDHVMVANETKLVAGITSDTELRTDSDWLSTSGADYIVKPDAGTEVAGAGTIAFSMSNGVVTGTGTTFVSQVKVGDQIKSAKQTRKVLSVASDTQLTVDAPWPFISDDVPFKVIPQTIPPFAGQGVVAVADKSALVTGIGTNFSTAFGSKGSINIDGQIKAVVSVQSDTQLTTDSVWNADLGSAFSITPQPVVKTVAAHLPHSGTGTLGFSIGSPTVTGVGTKFTKEVSIGDQIGCANSIRTVMSISSDTELTACSNWKIITNGAPFTILPAQGIDIVDNFLIRTELTRTDLESLFVQDLSTSELKSGVAAKFFINNTDESQPYLQTYFADDPDNPVQRIQGLTLKKLDRLNRFIRLQHLTGWSFSDLNWLIATRQDTSVGGIDEGLVTYLAQVRTLQQSMPDISIPALTALWAEMKTTGMGSDKSRGDFFDTIFNNPLLLSEKDPYNDGSAFNPAAQPPQSWTIESIDGLNGVFRNRLAAALGLNTDDVVLLGGYVLALSKGGEGDLLLTLTNLSWMYRLSQWSTLLDVPLDGLFHLLCLKYYSKSNYLEPPVNCIPLGTETFTELDKAINMLGGIDLDVYQLSYVVNGETGPHYESPYQLSDVASFVNELAVMSASVQLVASNFVFETTDNAKAAYLYNSMQGKYISSSGVFRAYEFAYPDAAQYFPIVALNDGWISAFGPDTFCLAYADISAEESQKVLSKLKSKSWLVSFGENAFILSPDYQDGADLSFLADCFKNDATKKTIEVQLLLSQTIHAIAHTLKVWRSTLQKQQDMLENGISQFISASKTAVQSLKNFAARESKLNDYLCAFFTPVAAPSSETMAFLSRLSRASLLADHLSLTEKEMVYITSSDGQAHFNIENFGSLTINNALSLIDYRTLVTDFSDRDDLLINYFSLPRDGKCPGTKINQLSSITGWNNEQICVLIGLFWPGGVALTDDFDTVAGLVRLSRTFAIGNQLGADIPTLLTFASIAHLDLNPGGVFAEKNWATFERIGNSAASLAASKFGETAFAGVSDAVAGALNTQNRDALLPFTVWKINADNPSISKPSDLYSYLLIDVEMCSCALTSRIAQGIASVQLYMQRCRMMLESGVNIVDVPKIWWDWMSSYRIWEVNRKIFLYPENYIEPTLRSKVTPEFKEFSDALLQNDINKSSVKEPYQKYLQRVDLLGNLVHIASYNTTRQDAHSGEEKETLFIIGRTNIQPYTYYMRKLDDLEDWGPWLKIDIAINASSITPVYAFDRIFVFWTEKSVNQSSAVKSSDSSTETVNVVEMKFSFYDDEKWVLPQVLFSKEPINAFPSNYVSIQTPEIEKLMDDRNAYWNIPHVISSGKGFIGKGRMNISAGMQTVTGKQTLFLHEVTKGDTIWCMGEKRIVGHVSDNKMMVVTEPWLNSADGCEYKIIPHEKSDQTRSFPGTGQVTITADLQNVSGNGTRFTEEFSYGDNIVIGGETRMVLVIIDDTNLLVASVWNSSAINVTFLVRLGRNAGEQLIAMFGGNLPTNFSQPAVDPTIDPNPTRNIFIGARNEINKALFSSLTLAKQMGPDGFKINGDVTMGPVQILDSNFLKHDTSLVITDYRYAAQANPMPYRADLDRTHANLAVVPDQSALKNNYWGNNIAGTTNNAGGSAPGVCRMLLSQINKEKSSLINVGNQPGWFMFDNSDEAFMVQAQQPGTLNKLTEMALFQQRNNSVIVSTQAYAAAAVPFNDQIFKFTRLTTNVTSLLIQKLFAGGIDNLLTLRSQEIPELPFARFFPTTASVTPPASPIMDFSGSYGLYFWEIFFHGPFLVADRLNMNKRYEEAKQWLEYVFNPTVNEDDASDPDPDKRYWRFRPFRSMDRESLSNMLTDPAQLRRYNYDPFDPDAIAKYRHVAYAKAAVMKYIDNILDWGDFLFSQDTSESINQATNLYVLANDLLGKRPESQGKIPAPEAKSFNDIKKEYLDQIPQFLIELENTPEVKASATLAAQFSSVPFNKINSYFCVPENAELMAYWDRVEDRLYKIRHCENMQGVFRQLPLFAPPIDPHAFIRAYAAGGGGFGLMSSFSAPIPCFKFAYLIEKARYLAAQVSNLGNALLSALEKKDAEALNLIRLQQEKGVLLLTTAIKETQIKVIEQQKASQQESLNNATYRFTHYDNLLTDGISNREQVSMDAALAATVLNAAGAITKTAAAIGYAVPQAGSPFAMTYGGQQLGNALNAASGAFEIGGLISSYVSQHALTMAGYDRRTQDWTLQSKIAGYDQAMIKVQLNETDLQMQIAKQDLAIHLQSIKNGEDIEAFYKDKFTNKDLYQWMATRISTVYFQAYNLAYSMAKAAERAYQFQYNSDRSFINYGYWDGLYKGLGAAEGLMLALDQLDSSSVLDVGYRRLEIEKSISLLQLNPKALIDLKTKGECVFEFNEKLFDYDFPGHYLRTIKTISISVPAVVGPYQNIHATLTQLNNQLVLKSDKSGLDAVNYLLGADTAKLPNSSVLRSNCWANQQIALSKGTNDTGLFELNFEDARFLPFEGTGAVSTWRLSMPFATNRIQFEAISDVVINLKYTAMDGGDKFRQDVMQLKAFKPYSGVGYCNFNQMYPTAWHAFLHNHAITTTQTLNFNLADFVPPHVQKAKLIGFYFRLDTAASAAGAYVTVKISDSLSVLISLTPANDCTYSFKKEGKAEPLVSKVLGERSISFDLLATPPALKGSDGFLDPGIVENIELILFYDGEAG